jgi:phage gp36-like protein
MAYTSQSALNSRFGQAEIDSLLDRNREGTPDTAALAAVIRDADALIDGYIGGKYTLPLVFVPDLLANLSADIVRFRLYDAQAPEEVRRRYEDALAVLKGIASGEVVLPPGVNGAVAAQAITLVGYSAERVFTEETLADY